MIIMKQLKELLSETLERRNNTTTLGSFFTRIRTE